MSHCPPYDSNPHHPIETPLLARGIDWHPNRHPIRSCAFSEFGATYQIISLAVKWFAPGPQGAAAVTALILNMPNPHFENHRLTGQGVIEIEGHGLLVNGLNFKRNERPPGAR